MPLNLLFGSSEMKMCLTKVQWATLSGSCNHKNRERKKNTTPSGCVCEGRHTILCEISGFKYDTYICLMALPPSEPLKRLVQLKESRARVSLLNSALFLQVTCLSLELTTKMHSLAAMRQRKKRKYLISICSVPPLRFHVHFCDGPWASRNCQRHAASKDVRHSLSLSDIQPVVIEAAFQI